MKPKVLVVDDDPGIRYTLREILEDAQMDVLEAQSGEQALDRIGEQMPHLVLTDLAMPGMDGMQLLEQICKLPSPPRTILITAHGSERHAVEAIKRGAYDYFSKPFEIDSVVRVIERAVSSVRADLENERLRAELHLSRHMVFASGSMSQVALLIHRVGGRDVNVLITGPSGTGKERVAQALVAASLRKKKPFVRFNCAAVPSDLAEAELFGHTKGAFTGAHKERLGLFRQAAGGTLMLDEVGELDLLTQGKLLRALQEGSVRPVGEDREIKVDVRLIAVTNRDLSDLVSDKRFREDLFYRLNVVNIHIPPLSQRTEDIPPLIDHFLAKYTERFGTGPRQLSQRLRQKLLNDSYPGNVRELENRIERLVAISQVELIDETDQDLLLKETDPPQIGLKERVEAFERGLISAELNKCNGNRSQTARNLGIGRVTLLDKLKKYGLE